MIPARRVPVAGLALALALTLAGCGDDRPEAEQPPSASSSAAPEASSSATEPSPDDTASASESQGSAAGDTYADASPATGLELVSGAGSIRIPADWPQDQSTVDTNTLSGPSDEYAVQLSDSLSSGNPDTGELVEANLAVGSYTDAVQRLDDVVIAGQRAYHLAGPDEIFPSFVDEFGLVANGREYTIRVSTPEELPQTERDALVASVVASVQVAG